MFPDARSPRAETPSALPPGTRLGEFELLSLLGVGGFGIVYLAFDHALEREVAVKEYMPASLAGRTETLHVSVRSQSDIETFALGLKSFVNEARLLARFDHPSLLKVLRFWEANGTAYMAMPVMRGRTVKEVRADMQGAPGEVWLRELLEPLLGAIERLHSEGVYHRDIAPDNIQIEPDGHPVLLDFGAARRVIGDKSQTLTAILKPAYAPIEQYAEVGSVKQGPWTDIYALGATLHYLLLGRPPAPATARAVHDEASLLTAENLPGCSANFLHIVDWMLAPRPADRPQNVAALRDALAGRTLPPRRRDLEPPPSQWDRTTVLLPASAVEIALEFDDQATLVLPSAPRSMPDLTLPDIATPVVAVPVAAPAQAVRPPLPPLPPASQPTYSEPDMSALPPSTVFDQAPAAAARSRLLPVVVALVALVVVLVGVMLWPRSPAVPPAVDLAASASAPAAMASPTPATARTVRPESAVTTVIVQAAPPVRAAADPRPAVVAAKPAGERPAADRTALATSPGPAITPPPLLQGAVKSPSDAALPAAVPVQVAAAPAPLTTQPAAPVAVTEPPKPAATGPEAKCGGRNPVMYFICMERECLRSEFLTHADCRAWRKEAKRD